MIYLLGGAGYGNFGDELIVKQWLHRILSVSGRHVRVDGDRAITFQYLFGGIFDNVSYTDTFCRLRYNGPKSFWASFVRGLKFFANGGVGRYPEYAHLDKELDQIEIVHLYGGGYLNEIWAQNGFLLGVAVALKRRNGCRLVATGIGLGPLSECEEEVAQLFSEALEEFEIFECRDVESFRILRRYNQSPRLFFGLDDTFLATDTAAPEGQPRTLHVSHYSAAGSDDLAKLLKRLHETKLFERFLFWKCADRDGTYYDLLREALPEMVALSLEELLLAPLPVAPGDFMATARFHPHLLAARQGAVGVYYTDSAYYDTKHGSVTALGSPFVDLRGFTDRSLIQQESAWIVEMEDERASMKRKVADRIYGQLP